MMPAARPPIVWPPTPVPVAPVYCQSCGALQFECSSNSVIRIICRKCKAPIVVRPRG